MENEDGSMGVSPQPDGKPFLSVIVCTRNRGDSIVDTIHSILSNDYPHFELLVIDQSTNPKTRAAIQPFLSDPRVCYLPSATNGKGVACNFGLQNAKAELVVFTDDDCIVSSAYLGTFENLFATYPRVAMIFCSVIPGPHNPAEGTIPQVRYPTDRIIDRFTPRHFPVVMGAGMAMRKSVVTRWGGFDELIGPGSFFKSGDDTDLAMRTLSHHHAIYQLAQEMVTHYGFRSNQDFRRTIANNYNGLGAIHAKYVRMLDLRIIPFILFNVFVRCFWQPLRDSIKNRKIHGFGRLLYYTQGFFKGLNTPVDRNKLRYRVSN